MKYFFLSFFLLTILVVGVLGMRGEKFGQRPLRIFPDMDEQDFLKGQKPSAFFKDGMGARLPVAGTVPNASDDGVFPVEFGEGMTGHYYTGAIDDYFANGMPKDLGLTDDNVESFLRRGQDRYAIFCAICHGDSGNGKGTVSRYMSAPVADLHQDRLTAGKYPEGKIYHVISHGQGLMGSYGANIPVRDRWAIVAYVRALQDSQKVPAVAGAETETESPQSGTPKPATN